MATQKQIDKAYNYLDEILRLTYGENFDYSCAMYNGDFSKTLEQAQKDKHDYILKNINFTPGSRVLDVGCGWGPVLRAVREAGGSGTGLTLSTKQVEACRKSGLDVHLKDWKEVKDGELGRFDGISSVGAFEHFCSMEEYVAGKQDKIYDDFFKFCHERLPDNGRLFLQTMMWGRNAPKYEDISVKAEKGSDGYIVAVLAKFYPGSWLPFGEEHIIRCASPYFKVVSLNNGRLDYLETMKQWSRVWEFSFPKLVVAIKMASNLFTDRDFLYKMEEVWKGYQRQCFEREIIDHQRMVFEKV